MELGDEQMLQMMAMENATGEEESVEAQVDVVRLTAKLLREKFEKDGVLFNDERFAPLATIANGQNPGQFKNDSDSAIRISAFLGGGSDCWSRRKVSDLLRMAENLHPNCTNLGPGNPCGCGRKIAPPDSK